MANFFLVLFSSAITLFALLAYMDISSNPYKHTGYFQVLKNEETGKCAVRERLLFAFIWPEWGYYTEGKDEIKDSPNYGFDSEESAIKFVSAQTNIEVVHETECSLCNRVLNALGAKE